MIHVWSFKFQVSSFKFRVSSFKFQGREGRVRKWRSALKNDLKHFLVVCATWPKKVIEKVLDHIEKVIEKVIPKSEPKKFSKWVIEKSDRNFKFQLSRGGSVAEVSRFQMCCPVRMWLVGDWKNYRKSYRRKLSQKSVWQKWSNKVIQKSDSSSKFQTWTPAVLPLSVERWTWTVGRSSPTRPF